MKEEKLNLSILLFNNVIHFGEHLGIIQLRYYLKFNKYVEIKEIEIQMNSLLEDQFETLRDIPEDFEIYDIRR